MPSPAFTVLTLGRESEPVLVVDNFAPDPEMLRAVAAGATFGPARNHYPGIRAPLPSTYMPEQLSILAEMQQHAFGGNIAADVIDASFSIVTTPPGELSVQQRLPHCDAFDGDRIAMVHYLSPVDGDGTAFFRHQSTGFETIDEERAPLFFDQLDAEMRYRGVPSAAYISADSALFELTMRIEARYNRAVLYRSKMLHSGAISANACLSPDPEIGRLTITAFMAVGKGMSVS